MRKACLECIYQLASQDARVVFIGSDITNRDLSRFQTEFPERFFMEGVSEQHLIGMAAGLAFSGKVPYFNTIATFLTRRGFEQSMIDLGVHDLPVRLIGSGGGAVYAPLGATHMALEDLAIMMSIPHMTVVAPCDADEMRRLMPATLNWPHPIYIRLAKGGDAVVSQEAQGFTLGQAILLREGHDVAFISTGVTTQIGLAAAARLAESGQQAAVLHVHTLKPFDREAVVALAGRVRAVVALEEHRQFGGLGSLVCDTLMDHGVARPFARLGFPDVFTEEHGSQAEILRKYGITAENAASVAARLL